MKFTFGLLIGAVATAVVAHYLNSREGQALINKVKQDADEVGDNLHALTEGLIEKGKSILGQVKEVDEATEIVIVV